MEEVNRRKLQSIRRHRKKMMVMNICQYLMILVGFGLFLSSPLWLPKVVVFVGNFLFVLLPLVGRRILGPKGVFMLGNLIIVFLVGDSKLLSKKPSQPIPDVEHHRDHEHDDGDGCEDDDDVDDDGDGDDEKGALPADELKRRVEDFIARVNSQRSLEARLIAGRAA